MLTDRELLLTHQKAAGKLSLPVAFLKSSCSRKFLVVSNWSPLDISFGLNSVFTLWTRFPALLMVPNIGHCGQMPSRFYWSHPLWQGLLWPLCMCRVHLHCIYLYIKEAGSGFCFSSWFFLEKLCELRMLFLKIRVMMGKGLGSTDLSVSPGLDSSISVFIILLWECFLEEIVREVWLFALHCLCGCVNQDSWLD